MTRRIVYIATTTAPDLGGLSPVIVTTALCSDGTVWQHEESEAEWKKLPDIPQPIGLPAELGTNEDFGDFADLA